MTGNYVAYAITTPNKNLGVVRVVNRATDDRILVKGMKGPVKDLAFAHTPSEVRIVLVTFEFNLNLGYNWLCRRSWKFICQPSV